MTIKKKAVFKKKKIIARVVNWLGWDFLKVGNITMAREGDICRNAAIFNRIWTKKTLKIAARQINKEA